MGILEKNIKCLLKEESVLLQKFIDERMLRKDGRYDIKVYKSFLKICLWLVDFEY